jgi:uncharacterized membrane protein YecN with MAPEG domain
VDWKKTAKSFSALTAFSFDTFTLAGNGEPKSVFAVQAIDASWVKIVSLVPFFSPYVMLARVSTGHVEPWEFGLAVVLLLARLLSAWGLNSSLKQTFGRQSGAGLTILVTVISAVLILYAASGAH